MQHTNTFLKYIKELSSPQYNPLSIEEERELLILYKEKNSLSAFQKLVKSNLRFVPYLINRNFIVPESVDMMDIIQEGNLGIVEGVKRFDVYKYNCRVYSYCSYWVYFYINVYLEKYQKGKVTIFSYDEFEDEKKDSIEFDKTALFKSEIGSDAFKDIILNFFDILQARERFILIHFFGLQFPFSPKTLQEIGSMLHVNLERVRQLKERALNKLRIKLQSSNF